MRRKESKLPASIGEIIYSAQTATSDLASSNMGSLSLLSLCVLYLAGLFTSFSPCALGILPLTLSYISAATGDREDKTSFLPTIAYSAGLASVFVLFGLSVSLLGGVFGQVGSSEGSQGILGTVLIALLSSGVSVTMGLQLLGIVSVPLPSIEINVPSENESKEDDASSAKSETTSLLATFLLGGSSALIASPCATPVLTSILAFVAANKDPIVGAILLFVYTIGYSTPLIVVGATGGQALARLQLANSEGGILGITAKLVTPVTASTLIWFGTTNLLTAFFGDPSYAGSVI